MVFQNPSPQWLWQVTLWIGLGTVGILALLLIALFGLKWSKQRQMRKEAQFQTVWQPVLMRSAMEDSLPSILPKLSPAEVWLFLKLWVRMQATLRGAPNQRLRQLGQHLGCGPIARKFLASHHRSEKVYGLMALAYLHEKEDWFLLLPYLQQERNTLAVYAALGLLRIDPEPAAPLVIEQLLRRPDLDLITAASVFKPFRQILHAALAQHLVEASRNCVTTPTAATTSDQNVALTWLFKIAHALDLHISTGILLPFLQAHQPVDTVIGAMRLLKVPDGLTAVRALAQHPAWEIRNQVCVTLASMGNASDLPLLTQLLMDTQWWVRYRAAMAMVQLPCVNRQELQALISSLPDRYARDMAQQVFAESWPAS